MVTMMIVIYSSMYFVIAKEMHLKESSDRKKYFNAFAAIASNRSILAFGDSLTKGVVVGDTIHPYIHEVKRQILRHDKNINITTVLHGHPGASTKSLRGYMNMFNKNLTNFAFVLILCGTNDLVCQHDKYFDAGAVAESIMGIHNHVHSFSTHEKPIYTIASTIPATNSGRCYPQINEKLREKVTSCSYPIGLIDLEHAFNHSDPIQRKELWKLDGVHFTSKGSDALGRLFFEAMLNFSYNIMKPGVVQLPRYMI